MKSDLKKILISYWKSWLYPIIIAIIIATSFKSAIADWNIVPTGSMKPTIVEGDRLFIDKLAYDLKIPYTTWHIAQWRNPERGEIVVFYSPVDGKRLVKRVVGLPGDSIAMRYDQLIVNGKPAVLSPCAPRNHSDSGEIAPWEGENGICAIENLTGVRHNVMIIPDRPALRTFGPVDVPQGKYFLMGDNRDNSADSRYFGFVERSQIVGRAKAIVISLDINNNSRPRWERFFTDLQ